MTDTERLADLELTIEELIEENKRFPVIVEGDKDVAGLRALGLEGDILKVNVGMSLVNFAGDLARRFSRVIILTDWDRTGGTIARRLTTYLESESVEWDLGYRRRFARTARGEIRTVEALPALLANVRRRADERLDPAVWGSNADVEASAPGEEDT